MSPLPHLDPEAEPELVDLKHLGLSSVIGSWRVGEVLVDPGPSSCLEALEPTLASTPLRVIALTHIHLDHAGATGTLLRRFPGAEVWVHARGAPHLIDPRRLLASAGRLYGGEMQTLRGEVLPVARERIRMLEGGEALGPFRVASTPGHAAHHVAYLHEPSNCAFTGDLTGVRIADGPLLAPTPPPDIDLRDWHRSLDVVAAWNAERLAITHFGAFADVDAHLAAMHEELERAQAIARDGDEHAFADAVTARLASVSAPQLRAAYGRATSPAQNYRGLVRSLSLDERGR